MATTRPRRMSRRFLGLLFLISAALFALAACSSAPAPAQPSQPQQPAPAPAAQQPAPVSPGAPAQPQQPAPAAPAAPAVTLPTATAAPLSAGQTGPTRRDTPTPMAAMMGPSGELTVAVANVGTPAFTGATQAFPINRYHWAWGIVETLATLESGTNDVLPMIATDWSFDSDGPDATRLTITIRDDVPFHNSDRWGFVDAEDVAFSMNDAGADNDQSAHDDGGEFADMWDRWVAVDSTTVEAPVDTWRFNSVLFSMVQGASGFAVFSKDIYDQLGAEAAVTTTIGTGPFRVNQWLADEVVDMEAVEGHWRQTPGFQSVRVLEVPENSTRVAMLATGQAQIGNAPLKDMSKLVRDVGIESIAVGVEDATVIHFAGNYWQKETPDGRTEDVHGPLFPRPGFKPDAQHPWIGDPDNPEQFERARKFRWALSMAIDREGINTAILDGLGTAWYVPNVPPDDPNFKPEWLIPFDVNMAKQNLADAGHPNCLNFKFFIPPDSGHPPEVGEAVALNWTALGCNVEIERTSYSVRRPTEVNREIDIPWMFGWGGRPLSMDQNLDPIRFSQPGWNPGIEDKMFHDWFLMQASEANTDKRIENALTWSEYDHNLQLAVPIVARPLLLAVNPAFVEGWTPHREGVQEAAINNLETAHPAR